MVLQNSRKKRKPKTPEKPYANFPLFPHAQGYWAKKVRGRTVYFGRFEDGWEAVLDKWEAEEGALRRGRTPTALRKGLTLADLCDEFLKEKRAAITTGELSPRTLRDYVNNCALLIKHLGKNAIVADLTPDAGQLPWAMRLAGRECCSRG